MRRTEWTAQQCRLAALCSLLVTMVAAPVVAQPYTVTLTFDQEGLDLETGEVSRWPALGSESHAADVYVTYNADRLDPVVLAVNVAAGVEAAFLEGMSFGYVDQVVLAELELGPELADRPLEPNDTVVVATPEGNLFKLGNAVERGDGTVTLEVAALTSQIGLPQIQAGNRASSDRSRDVTSAQRPGGDDQ